MGLQVEPPLPRNCQPHAQKHTEEGKKQGRGDLRIRYIIMYSMVVVSLISLQSFLPCWRPIGLDLRRRNCRPSEDNGRSKLNLPVALPAAHCSLLEVSTPPTRAALGLRLRTTPSDWWAPVALFARIQLDGAESGPIGDRGLVLYSSAASGMGLLWRG